MPAPLVLRNRGFGLLISASAVSNLGDGVSALAFPWLATLITRDPLLIGVLAMAGRLPWLMFSLPAGVMTDRWDRGRIMVRADLVRLVLTLGVVALILSVPALDGAAPGGSLAGAGWLMAVLAALSFLLGTAEVLRENAAQTALPAIVAPADLERANGQLWSAEHLMASFLGPPLAGVLIAAAVPLPFAFDAATFAVAAGLVALIAMPRLAPVATRRRFLAEMAEGIAWMRANPFVLRLAVMLGLMNALFTAGQTVLVLYAQDILHLGAVAFGGLMTAGAMGGIAGGLLCPGLVRRLGGDRSLQLALAMMAVSDLVIMAATSAPAVGGAIVLQVLGGMLWNVVTVSYRQRVIPPLLLGRVNSVYRFFGWGAIPLGALAGGAIVAGLEPALGHVAALRAPYAVAAAGGGALLLYALARLRMPACAK
ncbi:MFS transporter [Acidimangrovimonas sediminis]|uniref:MFS transporter n=1 Tax=Acidimangrovimonas sediminis TaxID=2056283 RepID=UPI000C80B94D|nr:MFS transporter [Acidimangrovimonas sediminis]